MKSWKPRRFKSLYLFIVNIVLVSAVILLFVSYLRDYSEKLYEGNLRDIVNINHATANISSEFFISQEKKLNDILQYQSRHQLTKRDFIEYIVDANASEEITFQLIGEDYTGYAITYQNDKLFIDVDYSNIGYVELQKIFDDSKQMDEGVFFSPEFTDQNTAVKSFARYAYLRLKDESGVEQTYTLMSVSKSSDFENLLSSGSGFEGLSQVLINQKGNYILRSSEFKSDNFFEYLYVYNDLSLDEMHLLQNELNDSIDGIISYKNSRNQECVYIYTSIRDTQWFCITSVPVDSFHTVNLDIKFTVLLLCIFAVILLIDVTYLIELNRRLKESALEARIANDAKTDFLSRMSHDIRTPINVIIGMTDLAIQEKEKERTEEYLKNIQSSGKFLLGLVNDILDMNKVESGKMELHLAPYSFMEFQTYINAIIMPLCSEKNIEFNLKSNIDDAVLLLDGLRINQIFFNLLSNAVKFTPDNGHISLIVQADKQSETKMDLKFTVIDDGIGMSSEFQTIMFTAFSQEKNRTDNVQSGTGLGLPIVKSLVELMNGTIRVDSDEGRGTTFYIELTADIAKKEEVQKKIEITRTSFYNKKVLLCEDHPLNAKIIIKMLEKKEMQVDLAENGQKGVDLFEKSDEYYYDLILMDIRMPVLNGLEATKIIRALKRQDALSIPIIALTANAYDMDVQSCLEAGMNLHLAKPVDADILFYSIQQLFDGK